MKKVGFTAKFGPRYGATVRKKYLKISITKRKRHFCKICHKIKMKWFQVGLWKCKNCNVLTSGAAYKLSINQTKNKDMNIPLGSQ
mmetsp:Transcript_15676/g.23621  ORF Transcript_15676/g.23621 Transcript_15676/m.23621 type:complete len:85 (+) Transcript_15676:21-275(+)